jgi:Zn-dependent M28 family amino/carboxypeptidase
MTGSLDELVARLDAQVSQDRMRADVEVLAAGPRNRRWAPAAMEAAEDHVLAELAGAGWRVEVHPFMAPLRVASNDRADWSARLLRVRPYRDLAGVNLIARHPASPPGPAVVVGAHLDTVRRSPGADDNASGVATVLEIGRLLSGLPQPPAVVLATFDLEELGLVGAAAAARVLTSAGRLTGMIGLESVGYYDSAPGSQRLPTGAATAFPSAARAIDDGRGDFTLVVHRRTSTSAAWTWEAAASALEHRAVLLRDPRRDGLAGTLSTLVLPQTAHLGRSDHAAFWRRGVPSLMLTDTASFRNPEYHRGGDLPETLDYGSLAAVAVATAAAAATWSTNR